ncbi:hypothetical protein BV25DRAFT_725467 [Artomyces pyxidatus]|uniref:Uncharacterized protein n=1 Tax=Artomyces pyxidatus TaxID=48021 RepID=A0ACB8T0E7_9AGAM|nr:hypothetical protein BV25DRAFT_725467 [Artomyces pyxidatus]
MTGTGARRVVCVWTARGRRAPRTSILSNANAVSARTLSAAGRWEADDHGPSIFIKTPWDARRALLADRQHCRRYLLCATMRSPCLRDSAATGWGGVIGLRVFVVEMLAARLPRATVALDGYEAMGMPFAALVFGNAGKPTAQAKPRRIRDVPSSSSPSHIMRWSQSESRKSSTASLTQAIDAFQHGITVGAVSQDHFPLPSMTSTLRISVFVPSEALRHPLAAMR